jgi:hypothetical protein
MEVCLPSLLENIEDDTAAAKLGGFHWHPDQPEPAQADRYGQNLWDGMLISTRALLDTAAAVSWHYQCCIATSCLHTAAAVLLHCGMIVLSHWVAAMCFGVLHRYMQYLQELIRLPGRTDYPLLWHQAGDRNKHLLDLAGFEDRLYYSNITGNTDAAIVTRVNYLTHIVRGGLCVLFELKKMVDEASVYQAVCELVVASILSTQWKPVVVLTDLIEDWQLFWLNGATVKHVRCPSRATAVVVIKGCVDQAATAASGKELPVQQQLAPQLALPAVLADRKVPDLAHNVQNAAGAAVNPDLLDLADMLPAEEMQDVYARVLLQQVSRLPVFSTTEFKVAAASMYS